MSTFARLATLTTVLAMFLASLAGLAGRVGAPAPLTASLRMSPVVVPGRTTVSDALALRGLPIHTVSLSGDVFWVYESRTLADLENVAELSRGIRAMRNASATPARLDEVAMLRFDRATGRLMAVYRH